MTTTPSPQSGAKEPREKSVTRTFLSDLLRQAANDLAERSGSTEITAAMLGNELRGLLRVSLGDARADLDGHLFGPVLYPHASPDAYPFLKLRNFLAAFPEIVALQIHQNGDRLFVLDPNPQGGFSSTSSVTVRGTHL